ncbi:MAG: hypothetical protein M1596_00380 [Firmicutes bacterium]|nr:hypothetical protein [Bacillota bacterium]
MTNYGKHSGLAIFFLINLPRLDRSQSPLEGVDVRIFVQRAPLHAWVMPVNLNHRNLMICPLIDRDFAPD